MQLLREKPADSKTNKHLRLTHNPGGHKSPPTPTPTVGPHQPRPQTAKGETGTTIHAWHTPLAAAAAARPDGAPGGAGAGGAVVGVVS